MTAQRIAIDFETHRLKPGMNFPKSVVFAWHDGARTELVTSKLDGCDLIRRWLREGAHIGGHNVWFDLGVLVADDSTLIHMINQAIEDGRVWCTMTRQQLLDIARGELMSADDEGNGKPNYRRRGETVYLAELTLQALMLWWFEEVIEKADTWRIHYHELDGVPVEEWPEDARRYVGDDAINAFRIYDAQERYIAEGDEYLPDGQLHNQTEQFCAAWALALMSAWGMRTDEHATAQLREVLEAEQTTAMQILKDTGIYEPKLKSKPDGVQKKNMKVIYAKLEKAFAELGVPCPMTAGGVDKCDAEGNVTKKGRPPVPQTDKETYILSGDPDLRVLANSMQGAKILSTYVPVLERGNLWPICARYNVLVETGRTSCRKPNMQNPPRKGGVREAYVPRPGHVYCSVDFDTAELRSLAQVCLLLVGYSKLGEALQRGEDPHLWLAAQMLGIPFAECVRRFEAGDKEVDDMRQFCKIGNFGFPGGLGEETFIEYAAGYGVKVTMKQAIDLRAAWFATWTEMRAYFAKINGMCGPLGGNVMQIRVGGVPGARTKLPHRRRGGVFFTQAANGMFQGLTADGAKAALWAVMRACYEAKPGDLLYGVRPVGFLHDEILCEIPYHEDYPERASAAAYEIARLMREAMQLWIPDIPIKCGPALFRRWYKGAKAAHIQHNGAKVLVPSRAHVTVDAAGNKSTKWVWDTYEPAQAAAA